MPFPQLQSMGSALGRACLGLALRLCPLPWDILYQGGPIKGTKVLMGCRHPSSALAAGPGLGSSKNPHLAQTWDREGRSRSQVCLSRAGPLKLCEDRCHLASALHLEEHRQEAGDRALEVWTMESSSLEFKS